MKRIATALLVLSLAAAAGACFLVSRQADPAEAAPAGNPAPSTAQAVTPAPTAPPPASPAPPPADATITNAPAVAGSLVLDLPPLPPGATRSIVDGDGAFVITADGDLARGHTAIPTATTRMVRIRQVLADGSASDSAKTIAVAAAPWSPDAFPEMIVQSLTQAGAPGPVATANFGGLAALLQRNHVASAPPGAEPVRLADGRGIAFAGGGKAMLAFKPESEALLLYRWSLVVFRTEATGGTGTLLCINDGPVGGGRSGYWMPRLELDAGERAVAVAYRGSRTHRLKSPAGSVATDGRWNVALTYRRHGRLFLRVNGRDCGQASPTDSFATERPEDLSECRIGDRAAQAPAWALDGLWLGQSELSEAVVAKMEAWALGRAAALPGGAAASAPAKPVIDAEDFPHRYVFDADRWARWKQANPKEKRLAFQGKPAAQVQPDRSGWVRVFCDDFARPAAPGARAINRSTVGDSTADVDAGRQAWYAPGTNCAVGGKAICKDGNDRPFADAYALDPAATTLTMRLYHVPGKNGKPGTWCNSQFSSVNEAGLGHSWAGAKGFRVRAKLVNTGPELFPCPIWFYSLEHLFWRTGERIEFDIIELDDDWDNYGASHVHHGAFKGLFGHSAIDTMKKSSAPEALRSPKLAAGRQVCGINAWDGKFHTWEVWIEPDLTYINVDGLEVARVDTAPEYLERLYMYIDTSLKSEKGMDPAKSYDLVLDRVEAFLPATAVDAAPAAPFTARPVLSGTAAAGGVVTCTANVAGCDDVWYYWYADGQPRGFGRAGTYTVQAGDAGTAIRCMVRAVGAKDQPEAWTAALPVR